MQASRDVSPILPALPVLWRDDHLIAIHKPAGWLVHRTGLDAGETRFVVQTLRDQLGGLHVHPVQGGFQKLGPDLSIPHPDEGFDLTFCVDTLGGYPVGEKQALISEMWRDTAGKSGLRCIRRWRKAIALVSGAKFKIQMHKRYNNWQNIIV